MSTDIVRDEIDRFLRSAAPEVLCISGPWGVGKTYSWQKFFREVESANQLSMKRYAYVSLFGLNSLAELRSAVVENTIATQGPLAAPDAMSLHAMLRRGERFVREKRPVLEVAAGFFRMKDAGDALYRAAFLTVSDQLICFDDLERAGDGLKMKDVLGLASMLREQRACKVVLLLNKSKTDNEQEQQFDEQLEKVVDTFLVFEPSSADAVAIAIDGTDSVASTLRACIVKIGITNMRIIKKIERWARQLEIILAECDATILNQALVTVSLAGWSFLHPDQAPPIDFLRNFHSTLGMVGRKEIPVEEQNWRSRLKDYNYGSTDELDKLIIDGVSVGYFRSEEIKLAAVAIKNERNQRSRINSFSEAWNLYHRSLTVEDDDVLDAMQAGVEENFSNISPANMNATVRFLRQYGRDRQASNLIVSWIEANREVANFFSRSNRLFFDDPVDLELHAALEAGRNEIVDARDPTETLKSMAKTSGFDPVEDVALLSKLSARELVDIFDANAGDDVKDLVVCAWRLAAQPNAETLRENLEAALLEIAARSPMRADRLRAWGVLPKQTAGSAAVDCG